MKFTQPAAAREINRLRVLNLLLQEKESSRSEIARRLELNKPSTSEIVEQLLNDGLVVEAGKRETSTGRRPVAIALVPDAALVLGVDMGSRNTSVALSDLRGNILRSERFPTTERPEVKELCSQIIRILRKMAKLTTSPILGVVVALDGILSEDKRTLIRSDHWSWKDVPLAAIIEKNTSLRCFSLTLPKEGARRKHSSSQVNARASSWPCSPTNFAILSHLSAPAWRSWK